MREAAKIMLEVKSIQARKELAELDLIDPSGTEFRHGRRLLAKQINEFEKDSNPTVLDLTRGIKLERKIFIEIKNLDINYYSWLIGSGGKNLIKIREEFQCLVSVRGPGSKWDIDNDCEDPLHFLVETQAPPAVAYHRVGQVLEFVKELLDAIPPALNQDYGVQPEDDRPHAKVIGFSDSSI